MPTKNPRINVVLDERLFSLLSEMAEREDKSLSVMAKELIQDAVDRHEDRLLSRLAMEREAGAKKTIKHDRAWQ